MIDAASLVLLLAAQGVYIGGPEPGPAEFWRQTVTYRCGRDVLEISGFGPSRPEGRQPRVTLNGRSPRGARLSELVRDLSREGAVYRFTALCAGDGRPGISLRLYRGENVGDRTMDVEYYAAAADFVSGELRSYTGLQRGDADSFWFN